MAAMEEGNGDSMSTDSGQAVGLQYTSQKNFEIEKKIGKGQFSVVYKARCLLDNSIVALKKIQVSLKFDRWYWETELMLSPRIILNYGFSSWWGDFLGLVRTGNWFAVLGDWRIRFGSREFRDNCLWSEFSRCMHRLSFVWK